jgi:hypothetical protein
MTLHDLIQDDASAVFCNANDFAETVTYYPRLGCGEGREIQAVVVRDQLSVFPEDGDTVTPSFEVHVVNDDELGISSEEINTGGDQLLFATRVGKCATYHSIIRILSHDEGMIVLECR